MQIKIFNISIPGGEAINEDMNLLLAQTFQVLKTWKV